MSLDGTLMFGTGVDSSGFNKGINTLQVAAGTALGNIASEITGKLSELAASIPAEMVSIGSGFEASMSQVAATMGITSAAAEFDTLSDAAKEMGETTKFSASQAGEALNYLALAGYDAEKAVSALPTVLNVAAAGGMELAAASDMITDAMSALGLQTSQMADFSDKLAVTAQKSNTSVSQLGEAILTVGGTAKSLAGGVTEMNTVLGILADNGIKGAEGGTMLRNVILSLSAPTSTAAAALSELGVTAFDASGSMRPLEDTFADLNAALSKLSDQEKTAVLNEIFNKVDLKGVNALLGTSAERFDELSGYIDKCSGAAADMATTMDDNLKGDLTIMQSALEGLEIAAYEKFQTPMRTAVQSVTEDIGTLSASISDGALSESFEKLSDSASNFIVTLSEGAADTLPKVINAMAEIADHAELVKAGILGVGGAIAAANIATSVSAVGGAVHKAALRINLLGTSASIARMQTRAFNGELSLTKVAALAATGNINLLQLSLARLKAGFLALNPVMMGIVAVSLALGAAMLALNEKFKIDAELAAQAAATDPWLEQSQKRVDAAKKEQQALQDLISEQKEKNSAGNAEADNIQRLWTELQKYVDENGNVISSNERVSEIIGTLNSAYGMNIECVNGQIKGYGELADSMDDYIEKLRLEAKVRNMQPAYDEAIAQQEKYNDRRLELENELNKKIEAFQSAESNDVKGVFAVQIGGLREEIATLDETYEMGKEIISEYESLFSDGSKSSPLADYYRRQGEQAYNAQREATEELALSQEEATEKLTRGWKSAEHNYAIGVIGSEEELYAEKQRLWQEYGSADLEEHWQYYEDLIGYQQDYAKQSADEYRRGLDDRWNAVEHRLNLGLISEEDAYKAKLDLIRQYCPEYSDEWYGYYKDIYDYQQEYADKQLDELKNSIRDQIDAVKSGLKDILSEYNSKYKDIQSNIDSFKNKLLSLGEAFSVIENKDGSKNLKVNNLAEQMEEMRKYTEYVKKLKAEGASQGLIEELTSMDAADGMEFAKNLANVSDADFAQINDYYKQRDELAKELAEDLYAPDVSALNEKLVSDITEQFGMLPEEIQALGAESLNAFIAGLGSGDLSEQVESFIDSFGTELDNGLAAVFENLDEDIAKSIGDNVYEVGKTSGEDFVQGFNEALAELEAAFLSEQAKLTAEYSVSGSVGSASRESDNKPIKIENKVDVTLEMDGEKFAQKTIAYTNEVNQRSGK